MDEQQQSPEPCERGQNLRWLVEHGDETGTWFKHTQHCEQCARYARWIWKLGEFA